MSEIIPVGLGSRAYEIHAGPGLLADAGRLLAAGARGVLPIVTDENVAPLHLKTLQDSLQAAGLKSKPIILPPGKRPRALPGWSASAANCSTWALTARAL